MYVQDLAYASTFNRSFLLKKTYMYTMLHYTNDDQNVRDVNSTHIVRDFYLSLSRYYNKLFELI